MGRLADHRSRRWIIGVGATGWAVMASLCGVAQNYAQLFLARVGLGLGEATFVPSAFSMISDYFPRTRLPRAYAVLMLGAPLGSGLAFIIGGLVADYAQSIGSITVPLLGSIRSWQLVFLITGVPGIPLALWMLATVREPARHGLIAGASDATLSVRSIIDFARQHWSTYGRLLGGFSLLAMFSLGYLGWVAVFFMRTHGMDPGQAGAVVGTAALGGGVTGVLSGGIWCSWLTKRGYADAPLRTAIHALVIAVPLGVAAPLIHDWRSASWAIGILIFFLTFPQGTNVAAFQLITPNQMRAQVSAVFMLLTNVFGLGLGATGVALLTDYVFGAPDQVNYSLALFSLLIGAPALIWLVAGLKPYRQSLKDAESWLEEPVVS
jgi:MFS family permease